MTLNNETKTAILRLSRLILGVLFVFSGIVKCIDPMGGAIKIEDYFTAWGWLSAPFGLCLFLSIVQNIVEFLTGFCLLVGVFVPIASIVCLAFMVFFTPLTLYIAIWNPVSDCGCFGDALKLTNWQTFWKNVVFLVLAVVVFLWRNDDLTPRKLWRQIALGTLGLLVALLVSIKGVTDEPIWDFRPYAVGTDIKAAMTIPEGAPLTEYKTTFYLEKDGVVKEFDENNYPYDDSTWVYKDTHTEVISEGYVPPIHDFTFQDEEGTDWSEDILSSAKPVFMVISPKLENADPDDWKIIGRQAELARDQGYDFFVCTSSTEPAFAPTSDAAETMLSFLQADETMLKTMARSNPALMVIQNGVVVAKYNVNHLPFDREMATPQATYLAHLSTAHNWLQMVCLALVCLVVYLIVGRKKKNASNEVPQRNA